MDNSISRNSSPVPVSPTVDHEQRDGQIGQRSATPMLAGGATSLVYQGQHALMPGDVQQGAVSPARKHSRSESPSAEASNAEPKRPRSSASGNTQFPNSLSQTAVIRRTAEQELSAWEKVNPASRGRVAHAVRAAAVHLRLAGVRPVDEDPPAVTELPPRLAELAPQLQEIDLSFTAIKSLAGLKGLNQLTRLTLEGSSLRNLESLPHLPELKYLWLPGNHLTELPADLAQRLPKLQTLNIGGSRLLSLDRLQGLSELEELNITGSPLQSLNSLPTLTQLESLIACDNQLEDLPSDLASRLPVLTSLDLANNALTSLAALKGMDQLLELDYSDNRKPLPIATLPPLLALHSLTVNTTSELDPDRVPINALDAFDLELENFPSLIHFEPLDLLFDGQLDILIERENALDDEGSVVNDMADFESPTVEAASRWKDTLKMSSTDGESHAQHFYTSVMPQSLHDGLKNDFAARPLLTLIAGLAFTAENLPGPGSEAFRERVQGDLRYLAESHDPTLLGDCKSSAEDSTGRCSDRASYGYGQLRRVIEKHRLIKGEYSAPQLFAKLAKQFDQELVKLQAAKLATSTRESVEYYFYMVGELAAKGIRVADGEEASLYGDRYQVADSAIEHTARLITEKRDNPEYLTFLSEHPAVQHIIQNRFPTEYSGILTSRTNAEQAAQNLLASAEPDSDDYFAALTAMHKAGEITPDWLKLKAAEILDDPALLT